MRARVFGTECEYALFYSPEAGKPRTRLDGVLLLEHFKELTPFLVAALEASGRPFAGQFLGNGGRFYIDRGAHPEYATPECCGTRELVAHEKAGDRIVRDLVELAGPALAESGRPGKLHLFRNNVDGFGTTYGNHENYLVAPRALEHIGLLVPFLVTRQIFSGAGKVVPDGMPGPYQLSQRADFIDRVYSDRTSQVRGIINPRKRDVPRQGQASRLHILVGDSNMSEHALGLRMGATALVLRLLEEDALGDMPVMASAVETMKDISRLFDCPVKLENRKGHYNAIDIQAMFLEKAHRFFQNHEQSDDEEHVLRLWGDALEALKKVRISFNNWTLEDDPADSRRRIDWVLKLWLINRLQHKGGVGWGDRGIKLLDVSYHDLGTGSGIFERCQALDLVDRLVDEEEIRKAQVDPPQGTRARIRGMIIRYTTGRNVEVIVKDWERIDLFARPKGCFSAHPFDRHRRRVNRLEIRLDDPLVSEEASVLEQVREFIELWD